MKKEINYNIKRYLKDCDLSKNMVEILIKAFENEKNKFFPLLHQRFSIGTRKIEKEYYG
jgi:hypothetical protein